MKVKVDRDRFKQAMDLVMRGVASRATLPVLECVLIQAIDGLRLVGTDLETMVIAELNAEVEETGAIALEARRVQDLAKLWDSDMISIAAEYPEPSEDKDAEQERPRATLAATGKSRRRSTMKGFSSDEFPTTLPVPEGGVEVPTAFLQKTAPHLSNAAGNDRDGRPILAAVYIEHLPKDGQAPMLRLSAADGFRLLRVETAITQDGKGTFLCSRDTWNVVQAAVRSLKPDTVGLAWNEGHIAFRVGGITILGQSVVGNYPYLDDIINKVEPDLSATVLKKDMLRALRALKGFTPDNGLIKLLPNEDALTIRASFSDVGDAEDEIVASIVQHTRIVSWESAVGFNWRYLYDAVDGVPEEMVTLELQMPEPIPDTSRTKQEPLRIQHNGYTAVVMPMELL